MQAGGAKMKLLKPVIIVAVTVLAGCAFSIKDIDISQVEPNCARECTGIYSLCVSGGNQVGFHTEKLRACREGYEVCIKTCPAK